MASFYIFLPSNSTMDDKIGNFKVKLPETIRLNGEWEMSMREFNYTRSWLNIGTDEDAKLTILNFPGDAVHQASMNIPQNNYDSPQQLIEAIKFTITQHAQRTYNQRKQLTSNTTKQHAISNVPVPDFEFYFDSTLARTCFKNRDNGIYLMTSDKVGYMLGFEDGKINHISETIDGVNVSTARYPPDMQAGIYALMVHCDIVAPQLVGNTYANLLRMVPVAGLFNETITNIYNDEQYVPVMKKVFDSIEININDDSGKIVNFLYGRAFVTLHFRKRRKWVV